MCLIAFIQAKTPVSQRCPPLSMQWVTNSKPRWRHLIVLRTALRHQVAEQSTLRRGVPAPCCSIILDYLADCRHLILRTLTFTTEVGHSTGQIEEKMFELTLHLKIPGMSGNLVHYREPKCKQFLNSVISARTDQK